MIFVREPVDGGLYYFGYHNHQGQIFLQRDYRVVVCDKNSKNIGNVHRTRVVIPMTPDFQVLPEEWRE